MSHDNENKHTNSSGQRKQKKNVRARISDGKRIFTIGEVVQDLFETSQIPNIIDYQKAQKATKGFAQRKKKQIELVANIYDKSAQEAGEIGYMASPFVHATLPYRQPEDNPPFWERRNGNYSLVIQPGFRRDPVTKALIPLGYPYGKYPRLILAWLCREAKLRKTPHIELGNSCAEFLEAIGVDTGGNNRRCFNDQLNRLFGASMSFHYSEKRGDVAIEARKYQRIASETFFFWNLKDDLQDSFKSYVILDPEFFRQVQDHAIPIDMRALAVFDSCFAMDMYTWLTYRVTKNKGNDWISYDWLGQQLGADYSNKKDLRRAINRGIKEVQKVWRDLTIEPGYNGGFYLKTSRPHIPLLER
jgi:hypothetical protein